MSLYKNILLARFRLNPEPLKDYEIAVLDFPYLQALNDFQDSIKAVRGTKYLEWSELPPYEQLNDLLTASAPMLIHPFVKVKMGDENRRRMMVLASAAGRPLWRPDTKQIMRIVREWASLWAKTIFSGDIEAGPGLEAYRKLIDDIQQLETSDWHIHNAFELWGDLNSKEKLVWNAIPSVLAAILVLQKQTVTLQESTGNSRSFTWQLTQNRDKRLALTSPPLESARIENGKERKGIYAYLLDFSIQTQAGSEHPWIYLYPDC